MKLKLLFILFIIPFFTFSQIQIGTDIDGEAVDDNSGYSISLSSDGSIVAIGAYGNDGNGSFSGHVRVYENISGVWTQIGADIDGELAGDYSGGSVTLSSDGSIVAIGARYNDGNGSNSGHVRVYENIAGVWTQIGADIDGEAVDDNSGYSVSLSSDGSIVAIGAYLNDGNGTGSGHVRVYENILGVWTQIGSDIDGLTAGEQLGWTVDLSSNGNIVAIGLIGKNTFTGAVRVYENISGVWTQIGADIDGVATLNFLGVSIALSSNGNIVAIGAYGNDGNGTDSGHVRVYENILGVWTQIGADINGEFAGDWSGNSVSLSSDGIILVIGAPRNDGNGTESGHVRVYQNISGVWTQIGIDIDGELAGDWSGSKISISSDGGIVAIGSQRNAGNGSNSGHVRIYDISAVILGLEDNFVSKSFIVFPNPVIDNLQLQLANSLTFKKAIIYNYFGQQLLESKKTTINVSNLTTGVYFVVVETDQGKGIKKIIRE